MDANPSKHNPYATPANVPDQPMAHSVFARTTWTRRLIVLQSLVIVVSLVVEAYEHESIIGTGPIFSLIGLVIAIVAFRYRDHVTMVFGGSAIVFSLLIVFLINYNSWSPAQGDRPITIMAFTYAAVALPVAAWIVWGRPTRRDDFSQPM